MPRSAQASLSNFQMQQFDQKDSRGEAAPHLNDEGGAGPNKLANLVDNSNKYVYYVCMYILCFFTFF